MKVFQKVDIFFKIWSKVCTVVDKKNGAPFETFFAMIISLWVFETQMKNWYYLREILNFIMMCLVGSYSHLFKRYGCVSENDTLCSQSRLIHFLTSYFKNFLFVNVSMIKIILQKILWKNMQFLVAVLSSQQQYGFEIWYMELVKEICK